MEEETGENRQPVTNHLQIFYHIMLYRIHLAMSKIPTLTTLVAIATCCIDGCKSNYHTIMTAPNDIVCFTRLVLSPPLRYIYIVVQCFLSSIVEYGATNYVVDCVKFSA